MLGNGGKRGGQAHPLGETSLPDSTHRSLGNLLRKIDDRRDTTKAMPVL
jgi:hypothetical protein